MNILSALTAPLFPLLEELSQHHNLKCLGHFPRLRNSSQQERFLQRIEADHPDLLLIDLPVLPRNSCMDFLKRCRSRHPEVRVVLCHPREDPTGTLHTLLYAMQILDIHPYNTSARGVRQLTKALLYTFYHPRTLPDILSQLAEQESDDLPAPKRSWQISIASLTPGVGCTQLVLHLAATLDRRAKTLVVEQNPENPVLRSFFLDEAHREASGLYGSSVFSQTRFIPYPAPAHWERSARAFEVTVVDLGTLNTPDKQHVFHRSDLCLLVTTGSPWHMQTVANRKEDMEQVCLWINFCIPQAFSDYSRILGTSFAGIYGGQFAADPLHPTPDQVRMIQTLWKHQKLPFLD